MEQNLAPGQKDAVDNVNVTRRSLRSVTRSVAQCCQSNIVLRSRSSKSARGRVLSKSTTGTTSGSRGQLKRRTKSATNGPRRETRSQSKKSIVSNDDIGSKKQNENAIIVAGPSQNVDGEECVPVLFKDLGRTIYLNKVELPYAGLLCSPRCFMCYEPGTIFTCVKCGKHFHRKCGMGYPFPIFNKPLELVSQAVNVEDVRLLECRKCRMSDVISQSPRLQKLPFDILSAAILKSANAVSSTFPGDEFHNLLEDKSAMSLTKIKEKAEAKGYKTIGSFYQDYEQIMYDAAVREGKKSESFEVAEKFISAARKELELLKTCPECYGRRYNYSGIFLSSAKFGPKSKETCSVPHALVWVRMSKMPFYPAKALYIDKENKLFIQRFGSERAIHPIDLRLGNTGIKILTFSRKYPGSSPKKCKKAVTDCRTFIKRMEGKFGVVKIDEKPLPFMGDLDALKMAMFPEYFEGQTHSPKSAQTI